MKYKILIILTVLLLVGCSSKIVFPPLTEGDVFVENKKDFVLLLTDLPFEQIVEKLEERGFIIKEISGEDALLLQGEIHVTVVPNNMTEDKKYAIFVEK